jgi:hypothetical protein
MFEQGFGDQIMLARFLAPLRAAGAQVMLTAKPPLARLFAPLADSLVLMESGAQAAVPAYDAWTHLFTLPERLGITPEALSGEPYLEVPAAWAPADRVTGGAGLFWRTGDPRRDLPEDLARRLFDRGVISLHPEETGATDFADTAALVARLDVVITIDSAVAHLAGALGKPVWVLLPARSVEWRWMREREDSPWYRSARLFRQGADARWEGVIDRVEAELPAILRDRGSA